MGKPPAAWQPQEVCAWAESLGEAYVPLSRTLLSHGGEQARNQSRSKVPFGRAAPCSSPLMLFLRVAVTDPVLHNECLPACMHACMHVALARQRR